MKKSHELSAGIRATVFDGDTVQTVEKYSKDFGSTIVYETYDFEGNLLSREEQPFQSFTANMLRILWGRIAQTDITDNGKQFGGSAIDESLAVNTNIKCATYSAGLEKLGLTLFSNSGTNEPDTYTGTLVTGLTHKTTDVSLPTIEADKFSFTISKRFENVSGTSKTCLKLGLLTQTNATGEISSDNNTLIAIDDVPLANQTFADNTYKIISLKVYFGKDFFVENFNLILSKGIKDDVEKQLTSNAGWVARSSHSSVVFDNKMWVMGGLDATSSRNDVWYSSDGINWTQATASANWSVRYMHSSVVFDNKMWVIGGYNSSGGYVNDVWYSTNGVTWNQAISDAGWTPRRGHTSVVFDNKMWVMGGISIKGYLNDVWYSTNGVTWNQAISDAGWVDRYLHSSVVFDNKMWVIGGVKHDASYADVWYSTNGVAWTQATASAAFGVISDHSSVVFDNKMWAMKDGKIWYSINGRDWDAATLAAAWGPRSAFSLVVFNYEMILIGGHDGGKRNDVWNIASIYFKNINSSSTGASIIPVKTSGSPDDYMTIDVAGDSYGIIVGTGTAAKGDSDYNLATKIANGTGAGQLSYGATHTKNAPEIIGNVAEMSFVRRFTNSSGSPITIREIGFAVKGNPNPVLLGRQLVDITINNGAFADIEVFIRTET